MQISIKQIIFSIKRKIVTVSLLLGSVTDLQPAHCGRHVIVGSHGGFATGVYASDRGVASLICHDAGIGLTEAGVQALALLDRTAIPAVAVGHMSARIGDPADMLERGRVTRLNGVAQRLGVEPGMSVQAVHKVFCKLAVTTTVAEAHRESRGAFLRYAVVPVDRQVSFRCRVVALDSASSVASDDEGSIIVTGSHGGLPGNTATKAMRVRPLLAVFNDAGIGIDEAGVRRLAVLDDQNIAASCVHAGSARIGDARSTYATGVISTANRCALRLGAAPGMTIADLVEVTVGRPGKTMQTTFLEQ